MESMTGVRGGAEDQKDFRQPPAAVHKTENDDSDPSYCQNIGDNEVSSKVKAIPSRDGREVRAVTKPTEEVVQTLREDNKLLKEENQQLQISYKYVSDQLGELKREQSKTQAELVTCKNDIEACTDEIFALQPPGQVSDDVVQNNWNSICERIDQWIDDESGHLEDIEHMNRQHRSMPLDFAISSLQHLQGRQHMDNFVDSALCHFIHQFLFKRILAEDVGLLGLRSDDVSFLNALKRNLSNLESHRDTAQIALWTSETLQAMSANDGFAHTRDEQARSITTEVESQLHLILRNATHDAMELFRRDIVDNAIDLASTIRCSSREYYFKFNTKVGSIAQSDLKAIKVLDVRSGKWLKQGKKPLANPANAIADGILVVRPALFRRRMDTEDLLLEKPVVLALAYE